MRYFTDWCCWTNWYYSIYAKTAFIFTKIFSFFRFSDSALNRYHAWFGAWNHFGRKIGNRNFLNEDRLIFRKREFSIIYRFVILVMELPFQFQSFVSTFSAGLNTDTIDVFISFALALKLYRQLSSKKLSSRHFLWHLWHLPYVTNS